MIILGLFVAGVELFSLVSKRLDMVCVGFALVFGGLTAVLLDNFLLGVGIAFSSVVLYFLLARKVVHRWLHDASRL